jgi:hypothetical protein
MIKEVTKGETFPSYIRSGYLMDAYYYRHALPGSNGIQYGKSNTVFARFTIEKNDHLLNSIAIDTAKTNAYFNEKTNSI